MHGQEKKVIVMNLVNGSKRKLKRSNAWTREKSHSYEFGKWFKEKVKNIEVPNQLRWLDKEPNRVATKRYTAYFINGYRFHTLKCDYSQKSQNSGVTLSATIEVLLVLEIRIPLMERLYIMVLFKISLNLIITIILVVYYLDVIGFIMK